jgi:hypothetical protein
VSAQQQNIRATKDLSRKLFGIGRPLDNNVNYNTLDFRTDLAFRFRKVAVRLVAAVPPAGIGRPVRAHLRGSEVPNVWVLVKSGDSTMPGQLWVRMVFQRLPDLRLIEPVTLLHGSRYARFGPLSYPM